MSVPPLVYAPPAAPWLSVLHVDADILILSKPSGLLSVPGRRPELADCLEARARARFPGALTAHRLDLETSGVQAMAMNPRALRILNGQFARRMVNKTYIARVAGEIIGDGGEIRARLRADWPNRPRQMIDPGGRPALTRWRVLARAPGVTRLALSPVTGRSHQLRVHLAEIGHPILGDPFYAGAEARAAAPRMQLHAIRLAFRHPADGRSVSFEDPCPF